MDFIYILFSFFLGFVGLNFLAYVNGGYPLDANSKGYLHLGSRNYNIGIFSTGVSTVMMGGLWFLVWMIFLAFNFSNISGQPVLILSIFAAQLIAGALFLASGIGIFLQVKHRRGMFFAATVFLVVEIAVTMSIAPYRELAPLVNISFPILGSVMVFTVLLTLITFLVSRSFSEGRK